MLKLQLTEKELAIIKNILDKYPYTFYAFGSRVKKTAKKFSDLDLCYKDEIPGYVITQIEEEFIESDLPFKVEIVNWHNCSTDFQNLIKNDLMALNFGNSLEFTTEKTLATARRLREKTTDYKISEKKLKIAKEKGRS